MSNFRTPIGRRTVIKAGLALGVSQVVGAPFIVSALGDEPVKIGMVNPLTGILSALAQSEVEGAKYAEAEINKKDGILGRQVELLVEDSANDVGTGVQKTRKLIERDKVDVIFGDVNSGIAYAMSQVTSEQKVFHIVPGGHTDPITGTDCKWNVFRVCNTTIDGCRGGHPRAGEAVRQEMVLHHAGLCLWPHAAGQLHQEPEGPRRQFRGRHAADQHHRVLRHADQGQGLQAERAAEQHGRPDADQLHEAVHPVRHAEGNGAGRRAVRAGNRQGGAEGCPGRLVGHGVVVGPAQRAGGREVRRRLPQGHREDALRAPLVRLRVDALGAAWRPKRPSRWKARSCRWRWRDLELPPDVALQPGKALYRAGDHELMPTSSSATCIRRSGNPDDVFTVTAWFRRESGRPGFGYRLQDGPPGLTRHSEASADRRPMLQLVLFNVTNGLIIGAFYVLMALGLSLILNLSNVINFAHGNFLALGGYLAFMLTPLHRLLGRTCWSPRILTALFGFVIERLMIRRVYTRDPVYSLLLTFGLAFVHAGCLPLHLGAERPADGLAGHPVAAAHRRPVLHHLVSRLHGGDRHRRGRRPVRFPALHPCRHAYPRRHARSRYRRRRSASMSACCGPSISPSAACWPGLAGVLAAGQIGLNPNMGDDLLMPSFIAIIVGGVGSLTGTLFGGLLIGVAAALTTVVCPAASEAVIYVIMMVVLLLRPRGLMGEEGMMT